MNKAKPKRGQGYASWFRSLQKKLPYPVKQYARSGELQKLHKQGKSTKDIADLFKKRKTGRRTHLKGKDVKITPDIGSITDRQFNYLKGLIEKVGQEFYYEMRVNENIIVGTTERQLSKKQAMRLIGHLKARADESKSDQAPKVFDVSSSLVEFEIETSYNTTMEAGTEKALLDWASKRFKRDLPSLKKIKAFIADKRSLAIDVPQYRIKRSTKERCK